LESHNYFFIFGGGTRHCPGKELGIAEISTFLHYFVTKYRYLSFFLCIVWLNGTEAEFKIQTFISFADGKKLEEISC